MNNRSLYLLISMCFLTWMAQSQILSEGFNASTIPAGWTQEHVQNTTNWAAVTQNGRGNITPRSGARMAEFRDIGYGSKTKLITPSLDITSLNNPQLTFYYANSQKNGNTDELRIYYKTSAAGAWIQIGDDYTDQQLSWTKVELLLPQASNDFYIAFAATSNWAEGMDLDDVLVDHGPSCLKPIALAAANATANTIDLDWSEIGTATNWDVEIMLAKDAPSGNPTHSGIAAHPFTATSLISGTNYKFYVRSDCSGGDTSEWVGPFPFTTLCAPIVSTICEDFGNSPKGSGSIPTVPNCWTFIREGGLAIDNNNGYGYVSFYDGGTFYIYNNFDPTGEYILVTPEIPGVSSGNNRIVFDVKAIVGSDLIVGTVSDPSDASTFIPIETITITTSSTYENHTVNIPLGTDSYLALKHGQTNVNNGYYIDNICIEPIPSCLVPTGLAASNATTTSVDLDWTPSASGEGAWDIELVHVGDSPTGVPTHTAVNTHPYTISGLDPSSNYGFYVRANCGGGATGAWVGPEYFSTACGVAIFPYALTFEQGTSCVSTENLGLGNNWTFYNGPANGFTGVYAGYNSNAAPADAWLYTAAIPLTAGVYYQIGYKYGNNSTFYSHKMKVAYGTANNSLAMTNVVADYNLVSGGIPHTDLLTFTVPVTGTYYFGFNVYSNASQGALFLDDIAVFEAPACIDPTGGNASSITDTTAVLGWTENGTGTKWDIEIMPETTGPTGIPTYQNVSNPFMVSGLSPETTYAVYVRTDCNPGVSNWAGPFTFTTTCAYVGPFSETFAGVPYGELPDCWSKIINSTSSPSSIPVGVNTANSNNTPNSLRFYNAHDANAELYAVSPPLSNLASGDFQLRFHANIDGGSIMEVGTLADPLDSSTFTSLQTLMPNAGFTEYIIYFGATTDPYFAFKVTHTRTLEYNYIDDIFWEAQPSCLPPRDLGASAQTSQGATLDWIPNGNETMWDIEVVTTGTPPTETPTHNEVSNPFVVTGLAANTAYEFYVRANCGASDTSDWVGPYPFLTLCNSFSLPFMETFSTINDLPACWTESGETAWKFGLGARFGASNAGDKTMGGGTYYAWMDGLYNTAGKISSLTSPLVDVSTLTDPALTFNVFSNNENDAAVNILDVEFFDGVTWNNVLTLNSILDDKWQLFIIDLSGYAISGPVQVRFTVTGSTVGTPFYHDILLDDIAFTEMPTCLPPDNFAIQAIGATTVDLSWNAGGTETNWNISWGTPGFSPGDANELGTVGATTELHQVTGLMPQTAYDIYVQAACGAETSYWMGPLGFSTPCIADTVPYVLDFESISPPAVPNCVTRETKAGNEWNTATINANGFSSNVMRYTNALVPANAWFFTNGIELTGGTTYILSYNYGNNLTYRTEKLQVRYGAMPNAADMAVLLADHPSIKTAQKEFSEIVFTPSVSGIYYIGFQAYSSSAQSNLYVDNIEVIVAPSCFEPDNLTVDSVAQTTATINWTAGDDETNWNISWGIPGYTPGDSDEIGTASTTTPTFQVSGLTANTNYQVFVQADCGTVDGQSYWVGPLDVTTSCSFTTVPFVLDFDDVVVPNLPNCSDTEVFNGIDWEAANVNAHGFSGNVLRTPYSLSSAVDAWFYTQGVELTGGTSYQLSYSFGNNYPSMTEKLQISYGTSPNAAAMVVQLADHPNITGGVRNDAVLHFTPTANGIYYIGFKAYSDALQWHAYIDDIELIVTPPCLKPSALALDAITATTAAVQWTAEGSENLWNISWGIPGYTPGDANELGVDSSGVSNYQINGLNPLTNYDVYVQADCGTIDGVSAWLGPLVLNTPCAAASVPYLLDFESASVPAVPDCTTVETLSGNTWHTVSINTHGFSGKVLRYTNTTTAADSWFYTQGIELVAGTAYELGYSYGNSMVFYYNEKLKIAYGATPYAASMNTLIADHSAISQGSKQDAVATFTPPTSGVYYIGFNAYSAAYQGMLFVDNIELVAVPVCPEPSNLSVGAVTATTAVVSWTKEGTETEWAIAYGEPGFDPNTSPHTQVVDNGVPEVTLTGLDPNQTYEVYVRAICGSLESDWVGPVSITTPCGFMAMPWNENFDSGTVNATIVPNLACWTQEHVVGAVDWKFVNRNVLNTIHPRSNPLMAEFKIGNRTSTTRLISPMLDMTALTAPQLVFYFTNLAWGADVDHLQVYYKEDATASTWTLIPGAIYTSQHSSWTKVALALPNGAGKQTYQIAFEAKSNWARGVLIDDISIRETLTGYVYEEGIWSPTDPSGVSNSSDNITVVDGTTKLTSTTAVKDLTIMPGATLEVEVVLNLHGNMTVDGEIVFVSTATKNGELGAVPPSSTITGNATVHRYMKAKRSYRMVSPAVTTTTSIRDNWQEGANNTILGQNIDPNPGFGTHITGSQSGANGFDATATGNPSLFTVDVANQQFQAVTNTDVGTLTAGEGYLMFVRGDRGIDLNSNVAFGSTILRATGQLAVGDISQSFTAPTVSGPDPAFVMFGNPYQSAVDIQSALQNSTNVNTDQYYVYDPSLGDHGAYVTVVYAMAANALGGTNTSGSSANKYLQPGQGGQVAALAAGPVSVNFRESDKAPGQITSTNATGGIPVRDGMLVGQLYTAANHANGGTVHDSFGMIFGQEQSNELTLKDAAKPFNFGENLGIDHNGTYLSVERRELPQDGERFQLYTSGYAHTDYVLSLEANGLEGMDFYLVDDFTGASTFLPQGATQYAFTVDATNPASIATDRFSIVVGGRLDVGSGDGDWGLTLYPNPLADRLAVANPQQVQLERISIYDLTGRLVKTMALDDAGTAVEVDVSDLSSATYMVVIEGDRGMLSKLMVKE